MKDAVVSVKYNDLRELEESVENYKRDRETFDEQLKQATLRGAHAAEQYRNAFLTTFAIVQYAIGHLDPMTFRGWPYQKLFDLVAHLSELPFLPPEIAEMPGDLRLLAKECKKWEDARAKGMEQQLLAEENARHQGLAYQEVDLPEPAAT